MKRFFRGGRGAWAASAVAVLGGCTTLLGIDKDYHGVEGVGGGGATSASTTSGSGTGGAGAIGVGTLGDPCPQKGALACAEGSKKSKLVCGLENTWGSNGTCDGATVCDTTADPGTCKELVAECVGKSPGDMVCAGVTRLKCGPDLVTTEVVETCSYMCSAGACVAQPSCAGLPPTCGPSGDESCCASSVVAGGTYNRGNDTKYPATVSAFRLDRFEITVRRFRQFMAGYPGNKPVAGAGVHPLIAGSGWQAGWDASLAADQAALKTAVSCNSTYQTWTDESGPDDEKVGRRRMRALHHDHGLRVICGIPELGFELVPELGFLGQRAADQGFSDGHCAAVGDEDKEEIMTAADQLMERGREQGIQQGRREVLLDLLRERFGALPNAAVARVTAAGLAELRTWSKRVLTAPGLDEVFGGT